MRAMSPTSASTGTNGPNGSGAAIGFGSVEYQTRPSGRSAELAASRPAPATASRPGTFQWAHSGRPLGNSRRTATTAAPDSGSWTEPRPQTRSNVPWGTSRNGWTVVSTSWLIGNTIDMPIATARNSQPIALRGERRTISSPETA